MQHVGTELMPSLVSVSLSDRPSPQTLLLNARSLLQH